MITCAINNPEIIGLLYQDIIVALKNAPKDQRFDHITYMKNLFKDFSEMSSPEVAAKYLQSVPRLIIDAKNTYYTSVKADLNGLDDLNRAFTAKEGITTIIKDYTNKNEIIAKKAEIKQDKELETVTNLLPVVEGVEVTPSTRFQTFSPLAGSMQSFLSINPAKKSVGQLSYNVVETVAPDKVHMVNALSNISAAQAMTDPTDGVVFQGKRLMFKAVNLDGFAVGKNFALLDTETQGQIMDSRRILRDKIAVDPNIAQAKQRVILIVSDDFGRPVYFDSEGNIVASDKGKIVYQFMRVVRKTGDTYTVRDMYNRDDQVLSPKVIARETYNRELDGDPNAFLKLVEDTQKEQMSELYKLQQKALINSAPLLPITGISTGVPSNLSASIIALNNLVKFPGITLDVYATIKPASKKSEGIEAGDSTIEMNGSKFKLERSSITNDIALEIAQVLTNSKIDVADKKVFIDQFIPEELDKQGSVRKHKIVYNLSKSTLYFNVFNGYKFTNKNDSETLNLTKSSLEKKSPAELLAYQDIITKILLTGGYQKKEGRVFINYDKDSITSRSYLRYDSAKESFVKKDYIEFLSGLTTDVFVINADPGFYNYVVKFTTPESVIGSVITEASNTGFVNAIKSAKDRLVERLESGEVISGTLNKDSYKDTLWNVFEEDGNMINFYNHIIKLTDADIGKTVTLELVPEVKTADGAIYKDVIQVYLDNKSVGNVAETFFETKETKKVDRVETKSEVKTKAEIIDITTVPGAQDPTNAKSAVSKIFEDEDDIDLNDPVFSDLNRKGFKKEKINLLKIREGKKWWNSKAIAPLRNLITFEHATNLVNSDVFATFIVNASMLADPNGKMATIKVNKANGSYFQNLTAYHESWHVFSQLFLTKPQKIALYTELKNYTDAKGNQPYLEMSFKELEEMLAEDFRDYVKTGKAKANAPKRNTLFRQILDFLKQLFGKALSKFNKKDVQINSLNSPMAKELFDKLYIGKFNDYTPLIENAMLYDLDRGIRQVGNPTEDALGPTDSSIAVDSIDSSFSETFDAIYNKRKAKAEETGQNESLTSASVIMLINPEKRAYLYDRALKSFKTKLTAEQAKLEKVENITDFNDIKTFAELKKKAAAVIKNTKGEDKYVFLTSQVQDYTNLIPSLKQGDRVKGDNYFDIKIVGDFYNHASISKNKKPIDIIVVSKLADAEAQLENYKKGGADAFTKVVINPNVVKTTLSDEQELVRDNIRILQQIISNWGDEKSGVIKYHMENSDYEIARTKYEIAIERDENGEEILDEDVAAKGELNNDMLVGKLSLQQMMSKETTYLIKSLFKVDKDGTTPKNRLGFKERADFSKIFAILVKTIGSERDRYAAYEKLKVAAEKFPEIKQLFETKYPNPENCTNKFEMAVSLQFMQDFGKPSVKYMQLFGFTDVEIGGYNFQVKESSLALDNTINRWSAGVKSSGVTSFINKSNLNVSSLILDKIVKEFQSKGELDIKKSIEFAKALGIDMEDNDNIREELLAKPDYYGLQYIFDITKGFNELETLVKKDPTSTELTASKLKYLKLFKENPVEVLRDTIPVGVLTGLTGNIKELTQLKRLAELQIKYGYDSATTAVIRANGNTAFQTMNWSTIASYVNAINKVTDVKQLWEDPQYSHMGFLDPKINTNFRHLAIFKSLFDANGKKIPGKSLLFQVIDGTAVAIKKQVSKEDGKVVDINESEGNTTTELDPFSKFLQEFHTLLLGGVAELPRTSEKKMSYGLKVVGGIAGEPVGTITKGTDSNLYVDLEFFNNGNKGEMYAIGAYMFGYLQAEFDRIKKFKGPQRDKYLNITKYNRVVDKVNGKDIYAGEVFSAFHTVLTIETKEKLYKLAEEQIDVDLIDYLTGNPLKKEIVSDIMSYFQEKTSELNANYLSKFKFISKSVYEKLGYKSGELTSAKLNELKNNEALTNNLLKAYQYNSWIHKYETSILLFGDFAQWDHDKEEWSKRIPGSTSDGTGFLFDEGIISFINNSFNKTSYASILSKNTKKNYDKFRLSNTINTGVIQDAVRESIYLKDFIESWEEEYADSGYTNAEIKEFIKKDTKAYLNMDEGDGMAYMTLDAYRTLHFIGGTPFTLAQEELYQKIIAGEPVDPKKVKEYFPVYKLHYFGSIKNNLLPVTGMHKFAVVPLIPGVNAQEGSELDKLHKMMLEQNVQYVTFNSGSKGATLTKDGTIDDIFEDKYAKAVNTKINSEGLPEFEFTLNPIFLSNLKEVAVINSKFKKELPIATQTRGIVLDNLFKEGNLINKKNKEVVAKYSKTVRDYTSILKEELLNKIGFELIDGRYIGDITKFVEIIRNELTNRDTPKHLVKLINTAEDKSLAMDISLHPEADSIEKLLMSFIQNGLIKQKTNGEPLVQTPSTFTNGIWDQQYTRLTDLEEIKKLLGTNTLPFYIRNKNGRSTEMKVVVALQGDYINLLNAKDLEGKTIGDIDRLNELIKDSKWFEKNREALTMFGPRIPNDATSTIEAATVWHFLPESFGNSIILSTEIVGKAGSDYDGDKLFMNMANINSDGTVVDKGIDNFEALLKKTKALEKEGKLPKEDMSLTKLIGIQKRFLQNEYKNVSVEILMLPENYSYLTKPNGTYLVDRYVKELEEGATGYNKYNNPHGEKPSQSAPDKDGNRKTVMSPTRLLEDMHNLYVHDSNLSLEPSLGIMAKLTKSHVIYKMEGIKMPSSYRAVSFNDALQRSVESGIMLPMVMRFNKNTMKNEAGETVISLSGDRTQKGTRITDIISHGLQGILDRAKDPFPFVLQLIPEAMDLFSYLIQAGVDEEEIFYLLNQPLVKEYFNNQKLRNSAFYKIVYPNSKGLSAKDKAATNIIKVIIDNIRKEDLKVITDKVNVLKLRATLDEVKNFGLDKSYVVSLKGKGATKMTIEELINALNTKVLDPLQITGIGKISNDAEKTLKNFYFYSDKLNSAQNYAFATQVLSDQYIGKNINLATLKSSFKENDKTSLKSLAIFMNVLELEKQWTGMKELSQIFSPDTAKLTTVQQVIKRKELYSSLRKSTSIDQKSLERLFGDSILSSFTQDELILDLILPLFPLRLNKTITEFISNSFIDPTKSSLIRDKFNAGVDGQERFTNTFNNAVINYIYQNNMSNFTNAEGDFVNYPEVYNADLPIIVNDEMSYDAIVVKEGLAINTKQIESDFANKNYLTSVTTPESYAARGLDTFGLTQDPFDTLSSYYRYVIEREVLRSNTPIDSLEDNKNYKKKLTQFGTVVAAYESYISENALAKSFNYAYVMGKTKYSYAETVLSLINEFDTDKFSLKDAYPILAQLSPAPNKEGIKSLQLNNKKDAQGNLANSYYNSIRKLADPTISKVSNEADNKRIFDVFDMFSLMMFYQHGVGASKLSFVKVLDPSQYKNVMDTAGQNFTANKLGGDSVLEYIFDRVMSDTRFKNYTVNAQGYNNVEIAKEAAERALNTPEIEEFDLDGDETTVSPTTQPSTSVKVETTDIQTEIDELKQEVAVATRELQDLEEVKTMMLEQSIPVLVASNLPKINPASAKRETGTNVGTSKDINPSLLDNNGVSVERAAEIVMETVFYEGAGFPSIDIQDIRDYIIDILQVGTKNYIDDYIKQYKIDEARFNLNELKNKVKELEAEKSNIQLDLFGAGADIEKDSIQNDLAIYRATVSENNGELPKSFMVNDTRLWQLYKNGNYNLVDSITGEIYMRNVNMTTGKEEVEPELNEPLDPELKEVAINQILFGIENQDYEERLAELGYDVKDILNNLAKAKTKADYNKILKIIDKLC